MEGRFWGLAPFRTPVQPGWIPGLSNGQPEPSACRTRSRGTILGSDMKTLSDRLLHDAVVEKIWKRDPSTWGAAPGSADAKSIETRLGWLDVGQTMKPHMAAVHRLGDQVRDEKFEAAYLLGMGGSSLCAEVLRSVFGIAEGYPQLNVLDTTDELTLHHAAARMDPARTLFIVASKSGGTVEVASMERFFWARMHAALGADAGRHFVAITDPGTGAAVRWPNERGYREMFINPPDIGGRFSALSLFGLVPAAVIGAPVDALLAGGAAMAEGCRQHNHANAGLELGAFIAAAALDGRDKLTVALAPSLRGARVCGSSNSLPRAPANTARARCRSWMNRSAARTSTAPTAASYPSLPNRMRPTRSGWRRSRRQGIPVLRLSMRHDGLGAEFFRWEFATAVAGAALGAQSVRRAERLGGQRQDESAACGLRSEWPLR